MINKITIYNYLFKELGGNLGKEIYSDTCRQLSKLRAGYNNNSKNQQHTMDKYIFPIMAFYQTLCRYPQVEEPLKLTEQYVWENKKKETRWMSYIGRIPCFFILFRKMVNWRISSDNWNIELLENSHRCISFHITRCLWLDTLNNHDCSVLCHIFCHNDEIFYSGFSNKIRFYRNRTLEEGAPYCDFVFAFKRK